MTLEEAKEAAKERSLTEEYKGCSVHVNYSVLRVGYILDDWYSSDSTVCTYVNGETI